MSFGAIHTTLGAMLRERAERLGSKPFLRFGGEDFGYAFADAHADRVAGQFTALAGVQKGEHVAMLMDNCPEFVWTMFALGRLGAVAVPLNTAAKGELLDYFLRQSGAVVLVVQHDLHARVAPLLAGLDGLRHVIVTAVPHDQPLPPGTLPFTALEADGPPPPAVEVRPEDPMFLMYTSGTTGPSKGVVCPHSQGLSVADQVVNVYGYGEEDILLTCLPLFHANALWYSLLPALHCGATIAVSRRFSASRFWDEVTDTGATQVNLLGAMANIVLKELHRLDRDRLRLRQCMVVPALDADNASPLTEGLGLRVTSVYAQTETFAVTLFGPDEPADKLGSAGLVRPYGEVAILDDSDNRLPPGEVGEIAIRPALPGIMMKGYHMMPEATLSTLTTLWFHSGDRGWLDSDGYLYFVDRKKDAIRRRGENISAYELEMILSRHPAVREAAAVAVPSELGEDDVLAFIVAVDGMELDFAGIIAFCDRNMPYFMVPRYLHGLDELPKTSSEKVEKYRLRAWAAEHMAELWDREAAGITLTR